MHHITIGADPEFACFRANELVQAGTFLDKRKSRSSRMNTEGGGTTIFESSLFGEDGSSKPFEVRPNPSKEPLDVVENIHSVLRDAVEFEPELMALEWSAGSCPHGVPIGGHIHFGTLTSSRRVLYSEAGGLCLDNYLGCILTLIEGPEGAARRETSYGKTNSVREQSHGFEYRLPGSWLVSPYVASSVLCLGHALIHEAINNSAFKVRNNMVDPKTGLNAIDGNNLPYLLAQFPAIWEDITHLSLYAEYKSYIDLLSFLVTNKLTWFPRCGMKLAWGLGQPSFGMPTGITMDSIWQKATN